MGKKDLLQGDLDKVHKCLVNIIQSFEFCYYLNYPKNNDKLDEKNFKYISRSGFFTFTRYALWRVAIVELSKLLNPVKTTDKYNIYHILNKLKKDGDYRSLKCDQEIIIKWEEILSQHSKSIVEVRSLRMKLYSHIDHDYKKIIEESNLTLRETQSLINAIVLIITEIYFVLFDRSISFGPIYPDKELKRIIDSILVQRDNFNIRRG